MICRSEANTSIKNKLQTENSFRKIYYVQEKKSKLGIYVNCVNFKAQESST